MTTLEDGDGAFVVALVTTFPAFLYYSEAPGYEDALAAPSELEFDEERLPGWEQTGYPGPADGYAALRGYEVQSFREDRGPEGGDPADKSTERRGESDGTGPASGTEREDATPPASRDEWSGVEDQP